MNVKSILSGKMNMSDIHSLVAWTLEFPSHRNELWNLVHSDDRKVSVNALWVMTHLPKNESLWLQSLQDEMADMLLIEIDSSKKRILLQLLREQDFDIVNIRTDLLDFCFSKINSEYEPYAVRCFSLYLAFKMCRHYPELIAELEEYLELLDLQQLSPGLKCALRHTRKNIISLKKVKN